MSVQGWAELTPRAIPVIGERLVSPLSAPGGGGWDFSQIAFLVAIHFLRHSSLATYELHLGEQESPCRSKLLPSPPNGAVGRPQERQHLLYWLVYCHITWHLIQTIVLSSTSKRHRDRGKKLVLSQFPDGLPLHPGEARLPPWLTISYFHRGEKKNCLLNFVRGKRMSREWNKSTINTPQRPKGQALSSSKCDGCCFERTVRQVFPHTALRP